MVIQHLILFVYLYLTGSDLLWGKDYITISLSNLSGYQRLVRYLAPKSGKWEKFKWVFWFRWCVYVPNPNVTQAGNVTLKGKVIKLVIRVFSIAWPEGGLVDFCYK